MSRPIAEADVAEHAVIKDRAGATATAAFAARSDVLAPEMLSRIVAQRRAANYLSVRQIDAYDNRLLTDIDRVHLLADRILDAVGDPLGVPIPPGSTVAAPRAR